MNVEEITADEVESLVTKISAAATAQLREFAARKKEEALIRELNASKKSDRERLSAYLERTTLEPIKVKPDQVRFKRSNQHLREQLKIGPARFKVLRDELKAAGKIDAWITSGRLMIDWYRYV